MTLKFAYILRGIPGSGKSTVARKLTQSYENPGLEVAIHSTDDLCMVDGEYRFDAALAAERHAQNFENFKNSLYKGVPCVICDNTNVKGQYYQPYVDVALLMGYVVVIVEMVHPTLDEAVERNTHGVPREVINQFLLDWEPAQHCITVDMVDELSGHVVITQKLLHHMRDMQRVWILLALAVGAGLGAFAAILARWLVSS